MTTKTDAPKKSRAHTIYRKSDGTRIPGTTTIINLLDDGKSGAFAHVAWKYGMEGINYKEVWGKKRDTGTLCHYYIECKNKGTELDAAYLEEFSKDVIGKAETGFLGYLDWERINVKQILGAEIQLVDEELGYGGTIDIPYINMQNKVVLGDYKTGKVYDTTRLQIAAYENLWQVNRKEPLEGKQIIQIDSENGLITAIPIGDLTREFEMFKHLLAIYNLQKQLRKEGEGV